MKWEKMGTNLNHEQTIMNNFLDSYGPQNTKDIEKREKFARRLNRYTQIRNSGHKIAKETKEKPIQS